eukprot:SAG22_NODE_1370_length_4583_cov_3.249331_2_plen_180_part_01
MDGDFNRARQLTQKYDMLMEEWEMESDAGRKSAKVAELIGNVDELRGLVDKMQESFYLPGNTAHQDSHQEHRLKVLADKCANNERALNQYMSTADRRQREQDSRQRLLSGAEMREAEEGMRSLRREGDSIDKSSRDIDMMMEQGQSTLREMSAQRSTLKGAQKKIYDVMNTLGMSSGIMK